MEDKLTLSVEEAAKVLGISRNLCYDRVDYRLKLTQFIA